jgi:hypothetical protein
MIKIERTYTITLLDSNVINYTITSNNPCITIDNASGSFKGTTKKIYVTYYVKDLDCFTGNLITVSISNDKNCSSNFTDTLVNECNSLEVSIEQPDSDNLLFNAIVTGGKPPYLFNWVYGLQAQFSNNEPTTGFHSQKQLTLLWKHDDIVQPGYRIPQGISVEVKDANGCISKALNYYKLICEPIISNQTIAAPCFPLNTGDIRRFILSLTNSGCGSLDNNPLVITYAGATQSSLGNNSYEITVPEFNTTSVVLPITVKNDKNIPSNTFNVTVIKTGNCKIKPDCAAGFRLNDYNTSNNRTLQFDNSASSIIDVVDFATDYIDYSTFTFIAGTGQVLTNATTLTITDIGVARFNSTTTPPIITYEQTTPNQLITPIKWQVKNECDTLSQIFTLNINSVLSVAPVVNSITKTLFFGEPLSTTITDTSNVTVTKFVTTTPPSVGIISISSTGVITYNPISYSATNQVVTLKPVNQYGKVGNSFTITYTILSPGIAVPLTTCSPLVSYSLFNLLRNGTYSQGVWTGSNITSNAVSLNTPGSYTYNYTVTNPTNNTTKATSVVINYISLSITNLDIIYVDSSTRKAKITTAGFTTEQLNTITRINIRLITNNTSYLISNVAVESIVGSIIYVEFSLIDENDNSIIRNNYNSIEVIIPDNLNECNSEITRIYNKVPQELISTNNSGTGIVANTLLSLTAVPSINLSSLTASAVIANTKIFNCNGTFTYNYNDVLNQYIGYKITNAIAPTNPYGVESGSAVEYSVYGTRVYPNNGWDNKGDLKSGYTLTLLETSYWKNIAANTTDGPGNRHGIWVDDGAAGDLPYNKWVGFSKCIDIAVGKIYHVGVFADNQFKLRLNGVTVLDTDQNGSLDGTQATFFYWHVYAIHIPKGKNTLELTGLNEGSKGGFGCVIYNNTLAELTAATSNNDLDIIFNSKTITSIDIVQDTSGIYESKGYTCSNINSVYSPCDNGTCIEYTVCT